MWPCRASNRAVLLLLNWELWFPLLELPSRYTTAINWFVSVFLCSCGTGPRSDSCVTTERTQPTEEPPPSRSAALPFLSSSFAFPSCPQTPTFIPRQQQGSRKTHHPAENEPGCGAHFHSATNCAELCATTRRFSWKKVNPECVRHVSPADLLHTAEFLSGERRGSGRLHGCSLQQGFSYCWWHQRGVELPDGSALFLRPSLDHTRTGDLCSAVMWRWA